MLLEMSEYRRTKIALKKEEMYSMSEEDAMHGPLLEHPFLNRRGRNRRLAHFLA